MPINAKQECHSPDLGFASWNLKVREKLDSLIDDMVNEGMKHASSNYKVMAGFNNFESKSTRKQTSDPTIMNIWIPLGENEELFESSPCWTISLLKCLHSEIDVMDEYDPEAIAKLRDAFIEMAESIDALLSSGAK